MVAVSKGGLGVKGQNRWNFLYKGAVIGLCLPLVIGVLGFVVVVAVKIIPL